MSDIFGIPVIVSDLLPIDPSDGERARRIVRHGLADVLEWLGEKVGPKPDDQTHALMFSVNGRREIHASAAMVGRFKEVS